MGFGGCQVIVDSDLELVWVHYGLGCGVATWRERPRPTTSSGCSSRGWLAGWLATPDLIPENPVAQAGLLMSGCDLQTQSCKSRG